MTLIRSRWSRLLAASCLCWGWAGCSEPTLLERAEGGDAAAQYQLAVEHNNREEMPAAAAWYRRSAEQDYAPALVNLGVLRLHGKGVPQDPAEAATLFRQAAEQDEAMGQSNLGALYAQGVGVEQDKVAAYMWFSLAAAQGEKAGTDNRDSLAGELTAEQIAEGEKRAREWKPIKPAVR